MSHNAELRISQRSIDLCARIWGGEKQGDFFAYYLEFLIFHLPHERIEPALRWLVSSGLVGNRFKDFVQTVCANSALELFKQVTKGIEKNLVLKPVTAKDLQ